MISPLLLEIARCPDCRGKLEGTTPPVRCCDCGARYEGQPDGYLDLRPSEALGEQTRYLDAALHADARHHSVSPPLLSAALRNDMLRAFLEPGPADRMIDLGCGSGRMLVWNRDAGARAVGVDVSPFFAREALADVDLALGDLRRLPFADGAFTKAYALDVLEHLSPQAAGEMLREAWRVLAPGGSLFLYSHVRKNSRLALGLRGINALARGLERIGLVDMAQERLRKSDHLNPIADIPELHAVAQRAGFRIVRLRYYTPLVGGFVENIVMRVAERLMALRAARAARRTGTMPAAAATARTDAKRLIARGGATYAALRLLTWAMKADIVLFGRIQSGPFFARLDKPRAVAEA